MPPCQCLDGLRRQSVDHRLKRVAMGRAVRAVETFKTLEQEDETFEMPSLQDVVLTIDGVGDGMRQVSFFNIARNFVDVGGDRLHGGVIFACQSPEQDVHLASVLGEIAGEFFPAQGIGKIEEFERRPPPSRDR